MSLNVEGKIVIITGASSGMGEAAARQLIKDGAKVILAARRKDRIEALAKELSANGEEATAVVADVTKLEDMQELVRIVINKYGKIDVLVNNAGIMPLSMIESLKVDEWNKMIDVNLRGVLHGIAAVLPQMKKQKHGHIITTASVAGIKLFPSSAVYSATKFAVRALMEGVRQELTPYNIRTTILSPGAVKTELLEQISDKNIKDANQSYVDQVAIPASSYARVLTFVISQPDEVDLNEVVFRPTAQEL